MAIFTPGDRFRIYGGRVAHVVDPNPRFQSDFYQHAYCIQVAVPGYSYPADDRPLCKECARAMERNNR